MSDSNPQPSLRSLGRGRAIEGLLRGNFGTFDSDVATRVMACLQAEAGEASAKAVGKSAVRFTRLLFTMAAAASLVVAGLWWRSAARDPQSSDETIVARVEKGGGFLSRISISEGLGTVSGTGEERRLLKAGDEVRAGMWVATGTSDTLRLAWVGEATTVELKASSELRIQKAGAKPLLLKKGRLTACVARQAAGDQFAIETPKARVTVVGTKFDVTESGQETQVKVREGRVRVTALDADSGTEIGPGDGVSVESNAVPRKLLNRSWTFEHGPSEDLKLLSGTWHWNRGTNGVGYMVPDVLATNRTMGGVQFSLPLTAPAHPFAAVFKGRLDKVSDGNNALGFQLPDTNVRKTWGMGNIRPEAPGTPYAFSYFVVGKLLIGKSGDTLVVAELDRLPAGPLWVKFDNRTVEEINIHELDAVERDEILTRLSAELKRTNEKRFTLP